MAHLAAHQSPHLPLLQALEEAQAVAALLSPLGAAAAAGFAGSAGADAAAVAEAAAVDEPVVAEEELDLHRRRRCKS